MVRGLDTFREYFHGRRCKSLLFCCFKLKNRKKIGLVPIRSPFYRTDTVIIFIQACEPILPAEYHRNWKLEQEEANKVRFGEMSRSEFIRNMNNGKYR